MQTVTTILSIFAICVSFFAWVVERIFRRRAEDRCVVLEQRIKQRNDEIMELLERERDIFIENIRREE